MKKKIAFFLLLLLPISTTLSQQASNWHNYTDMKNIRDVKAKDDGFWAASGGGAFFYNSLRDTFNVLTKADGLNGGSLTAITVDKKGNVWFGSSNGIIDVYNPKTKSINSILDIYNNDERTQKSINSLISVGDTIFAATAFGVSLINPNNLTFYDTYFKFGNLSAYIPINNLTVSNKIYACSEQGLIVQKEGAQNLSAPESWDVYTTSNGLPSNMISKVVSFEGDIIASTLKGLTKFNGTAWENYLPQFTGNISDIISNGDSLIILTDSQIFSYKNGILSSIFQSPIFISKIEILNGNELIAATPKGVMKINTGELLFPNGPEANQFPALSVDNHGTLWSASGKDGQGVGFYKFDGNKWTNFNTANTPVLPQNDYYSVYCAPDNTTYVGNWGFGFARIKNDNISVFTTKNTDLKGTPENTDSHFLVITGFAADSKSNIWILNFWASDRNVLSALTPDSNWYFFNIPATNRILNQQYSLVIDQYDTKWYISKDAGQLGLFYFNENNTLKDAKDDVSGYLTTSSGLNTNTVTSVAVDRRGDIWVGTSLGVNVITQTFTIPSGNPQLSISSIFSLRQQSINCIAVDPLNQKWIGTNEGLLHVSSDGTSLIEAFTSKNSPLLSDIIRSIAIDPNSGTIYVGTDNGLTSFETPSIMPQESFDGLFIYPNPFIIKNDGKFITIDGLIRDSDLKILTIGGKLVAEFSSPGGRIASWDGRDLNGNLVSSGIYLVVAYDKDGNSVTSGKIAILHE